MLEILMRLATLPVMVIASFALFFTFIFLYCLALIGCGKIFYFMLSLIPKQVSMPIKNMTIRIGTKIWASLKKIIATLVLVPLILLLSTLFRSLQFLWKKYKKLREAYPSFSVIPIIFLYFISPWIAGWIWSIYAPAAFGGWPQYHPNAFIFHIFFLPISLFTIAFVWGGSIEKRKKEKELEEMRLSWALDRIALKKHDEWTWAKNWEDSWKDKDGK